MSGQQAEPRGRGSKRHTVLVVESRDAAARHAERQLRGQDCEVLVVHTGKEGLDAARTVEPEVVLVGLELPDLPGVRALEVFAQHLRDVPLVALGGEPETDAIVAALRRGAVDFIGLPAERGRVADVVRRALADARSSRDLERVRGQVFDRYGFSRLLSQSPRMLEVFDQIRRVAVTDATVLIRGETGTGKELVSRAIHDRSRRKDQPFISVNCGAFTESLLESELFGHERGSFTGAVGRREGLFEMADGGSLFLDELGETSQNVQVNLLRVLEDMTFRRVGGRDSVRVDVRIIAATNVELEEAVASGRFREDLYYRLNVYPILLPPLRQRREDIPLLMRAFLEEIGEEYGMSPPSIAPEALDALLEYRWPGNVRQLRAMCERWVITRAGKRLEREHLSVDLTARRDRVDEHAAFHVDADASLKTNVDRAASQVERAYLFRLLQRHRGHLQRTADAAGITRRTLYTKMRELDLDAAQFRGEGGDGKSGSRVDPAFHR
jgi:DNA-binding NtrC family response regulator